MSYGDNSISFGKFEVGRSFGMFSRQIWIIFDDFRVFWKKCLFQHLGQFRAYLLLLNKNPLLNKTPPLYKKKFSDFRFGLNKNPPLRLRKIPFKIAYFSQNYPFYLRLLLLSMKIMYTSLIETIICFLNRIHYVYGKQLITTGTLTSSVFLKTSISLLKFKYFIL